MPLRVETSVSYDKMVNLAGSLVDPEKLPLLIPENKTDVNLLKPMNREELEVAVGGPGWKMLRSRLVLFFWLDWVTILGIAITVIIQSTWPVAGNLHWWHKKLFYRLQPAVFLDEEHTGPGAIGRFSEKLPYLRSLGVGVIIMEGLFKSDVSLLNLTQIDTRLGTLPEFHQFIIDSHTAGMKVILDLCNIDKNQTELSSNDSDYVQDALRYWLQQGVSGFEICNVDIALTEKTLKTWMEVIDELATDDIERIMMVREIRDSVPGLNISESAINSSLVESRSLIPPSSHTLSATEVAEVVESNLKALHGEWPSWSVDGPVTWKLQKVIMVLLMTLPGTPIIRFGDDISQAPSLHHPKHSTALFHSLSRTRYHEEALLYGTFTFLALNTTSLTFGSTNSTGTPPLAYLRSLGCIHFLVLFNVGSDSQVLDSNWTFSLPVSGMFVTSTGMNRFGLVTLQSIILEPHEAIVIKLFEADTDF